MGRRVHDDRTDERSGKVRRAVEIHEPSTVSLSRFRRLGPAKLTTRKKSACEPFAERTITLPTAATAHQIAAAIERAVAGVGSGNSAFVQRDLAGSWGATRKFAVGQRSVDAHKNLVVAPTEKIKNSSVNWFYAEKRYSEICVYNRGWDGWDSPIATDQQAVTDAVNDFVARLEVALFEELRAAREAREPLERLVQSLVQDVQGQGQIEWQFTGSIDKEYVAEYDGKQISIRLDQNWWDEDFVEICFSDGESKMSAVDTDIPQLKSLYEMVEQPHLARRLRQQRDLVQSRHSDLERGVTCVIEGLGG